MSTTIGHGLQNFAAANLKGTSLPAPQPVADTPAQPKTLPHALGRAVTSAAQSLIDTRNVTSGEDRLAKAMTYYARALDKVRFYFFLSLAFFSRLEG